MADLRVIDHGVGELRWHLAACAAICERVAASHSPYTLSFFRSLPSVVVGRHEALWTAVRMEDCLADRVQVARRLTGGPAVYVDERTLGWQLTLPRGERKDLERLIQAIEAIAVGQAAPASAATADRVGGTIAVQGFVQVTTPTDAEASVLYLARDRAVPVLAVHERDAINVLTKRVAETLGFGVVRGTLSPEETSRAIELRDAEVGTDAFVFSIDDPLETGVRAAVTETAGGARLAVYLRTAWVDGVNTVQDAIVTGDVIVLPPKRVTDLEDCLVGIASADMAGAIDRFFAGMDVELARVTTNEIKRTILAAAAAPPQRDMRPMKGA